MSRGSCKKVIHKPISPWLLCCKKWRLPCVPNIRILSSIFGYHTRGANYHFLFDQMEAKWQTCYYATAEFLESLTEFDVDNIHQKSSVQFLECLPSLSLLQIQNLLKSESLVFACMYNLCLHPIRFCGWIWSPDWFNEFLALTITSLTWYSLWAALHALHPAGTRWFKTEWRVF